MPATWLVTLKAVLPYADHIVRAVTPVFTQRKAESAANQMELLQKQIDELQQSASHNTRDIKELAEQLKRIVVALDQAAQNLEAANRRHWTLVIVAIALSIVALAGVLAIAVTR